MMTTNIAEVLNNCIHMARRLPITASMEFLRDMLQRWFNDRREQTGKNRTYLGKATVGHCKEWNEWSLMYHGGGSAAVEDKKTKDKKTKCKCVRKNYRRQKPSECEAVKKKQRYLGAACGVAVEEKKRDWECEA
ncbi:hypothetical protein Ddye_001067 [Dipteronia dyeriana]|uniref:Uncharacterized protein n=1 Tax=Dipteronia dyeriana TaxID=168575 RepID=A0AAD9XNH2_9ROSI|nr:hypothetical protein Ddye_001067 [Dipteronia dyeriana]